VAILQGDVRRISYRDEATLYTVAKLEVDMPSGERPLFGQPREVTVVGHFASLAPGEWLEVEGEWYVHPEFGRQFRVTRYRKAPPVTARGIERYLASGAVEGIGPKLAKRLVDKFGERTLEIIEKEPHRLLEVEGIGLRKKKAIAKAVRAERESRDALLFLQSYGIPQGTAARIYRRYGPETIARVRENPYRLAAEVFGIGFRTADAIAREMGRAGRLPPCGPRPRCCTSWPRPPPRATCSSPRSSSSPARPSWRSPTPRRRRRWLLWPGKRRSCWRTSLPARPGSFPPSCTTPKCRRRSASPGCAAGVILPSLP